MQQTKESAVVLENYLNRNIESEYSKKIINKFASLSNQAVQEK